MKDGNLLGANTVPVVEGGLVHMKMDGLIVEEIVMK